MQNLNCWDIAAHSNIKTSTGSRLATSEALVFGKKKPPERAVEDAEETKGT